MVRSELGIVFLPLAVACSSTRGARAAALRAAASGERRFGDWRRGRRRRTGEWRRNARRRSAARHGASPARYAGSRCGLRSDPYGGRDRRVARRSRRYDVAAVSIGPRAHADMEDVERRDARHAPAAVAEALRYREHPRRRRVCRRHSLRRSDNNAFASVGQKSVYCPRAEGRLATSADLLDENSPDSFAPVALVSRLDLMPSTLATCGEFRIVYAKRSGRTDPKDRVMLIFEGALPNPDGSPYSSSRCLDHGKMAGKPQSPAANAYDRWPRPEQTPFSWHERLAHSSAPLQAAPAGLTATHVADESQ